jgi:hypothetical protein
MNREQQTLACRSNRASKQFLHSLLHRNKFYIFKGLLKMCECDMYKYGTLEPVGVILRCRKGKREREEERKGGREGRKEGRKLLL